MDILVVEDEKRLAQALQQILTEAGYRADAVYDGRTGFEYAKSDYYDAIILDVMLPLMDGFEVVNKLRHDGISTPVLMLTARSQLVDKVTGLDSGADEYMTKPFEPEELLARLRALTRRKGEVILDELSFGNLTLDLNSRNLSCGDKSVRLSAREFEVLKLLMINPKQAISKEQILTKVWGVESDVVDNSVEAYVSFLRKKLKFLKAGVAINTIRMVGYRLELTGE